MSTFHLSIIVLGIICALLLVVVVVLLNKLNQNRHYDAVDVDDVRRTIEGGIDAAFRRHEQEFTAIYAEERRLAEWLKYQLENDEIDLAALAKEADERIMALSIKMAEDEVTLAANSLTRILSTISAKQTHLATSIEHEYSDSVVSRQRAALTALQAQETEARARLAKAQANLENVRKIASKNTSNILTPEDLGG